MRSLPRVLCTWSVLIALAPPTIAATRAPRVAAVEKSAKLSAELRELAAERTTSASRETTIQVVIQTEDIDDVRERVLAAGGAFERSARDLVLARVPIASLESIAAASAVRVVRKPRAPVLFQTTSEGVAAIGAPAWHNAGRKGAGVKVAILDVGFSGYSSLMGSELPNIPSAHVQSFSGDISGNGEEHGTAVAEIVYDLAPQAELYLVNFSNEVELDNAVDWLIAQHVDIINTSWGNPCGGPLDGTGPTDDLVQRAANAGILWVAAAGNFAQQHWSGTFNDSDGDSWHNFTANDDGNTVYLNSGDELRVCVEWDDWTNKNIDLDLYVWDTGGYEVESSKEDQSGPNTHDPFELLTFTAGYSGDYYIGVTRFSGARNPRLHMFAYPPGAECAIESVAEAQKTPRGVVDELRQFRDTVLASSSTGRGWTRAYYRHSAEVKRILLLHPTLAIEAASLMSESRSIIRSVLDRTPHVLTADFTTRIDRFLAQLLAHASPALREELTAFRTRAALPAATGQTATQYWDALLGARDGALDRATYPDSGYMLHRVTASSLTPPADSPHAFTAGAVNWSSGTLESFSSRGPTADGRRKPDLAAPDGVCTVTYADCGANGFLGTSAAAPHLTGAAALVMQTYPSMSLTAVRDFLAGRAVDVAPAGPDNDTGAGRLNLGSTSDVDQLPAPTLIDPANTTTTPLSPGYSWTEVPGAVSYRLMVAKDRALLPSNPATQTCGGCIINITTPYAFYTPVATLDATTTYFWQVQALGISKQGLWAQSTFKTTAPPEQTTPERKQITEITGRWAMPASKAIVLTHGWNAEADGWVGDVAKQICSEFGITETTKVDADRFTRLCQGAGWDVWVFDWSSQAPLSGAPWGAYKNAALLGEALAANLRLKNYTHVHFIAHSAGSNLIHLATTKLREWLAKEHRPAMQIQNTYLDAYEPALKTGRYGDGADWTDNYVDLRPLDFGIGVDGTKLLLDHAYNIDVSGSGTLCGWLCRHARPYRFYGRSVSSTLFTDDLFDRIASTGDVGFPLSLERGRTLTGLKNGHPLGKKCVMLDGTCNTEAGTSTELPFVVIRPTRNVSATSGTVNYVMGTTSLFGSFKLGSGNLTGNAIETTATDPPSWAIIDVNTAQAVNELRFKWRFATTGEGFLRVFVDGTLVREIDQRYASIASSEMEEVYIGGPAGALAPGAHRIVLRLDGFATKASAVELTDVDLGMVAAGTRRRVMRH